MSKVKKCYNCSTYHGTATDFCSLKCERSFVGSALDDVKSGSSVDGAKLGSSVDGGGMRFNTNKLPIELVPTSAMYALADVLEYGAQKYDDHNWRRGMKWSVPYACAMRHLLKWFEGEERDEESGREHLSHVLANISMLIEFKSICPELDDRFKGVQRTYSTFKTDDKTENKPVSVALTEQDLEEMAKEFDEKINDDCEYDPDKYCNGRT